MPSTMLDLNWDRWTSDGTVDPDGFRVLATTERFDHCVFTVREGFAKAAETQFLDALFSMTYDDPNHREMMDLEGAEGVAPRPHDRLWAAWRSSPDSTVL